MGTHTLPMQNHVTLSNRIKGATKSSRFRLSLDSAPDTAPENFLAYSAYVTKKIEDQGPKRRKTNLTVETMDNKATLQWVKEWDLIKGDF